ncbi:hypothetical protein AVEN_251406-1 [Araneus ventricosus]|uniref:Uncharacterized protein n=1 Tax=Araneus ventricosus TaxID=182803 RepID=A0A4Y2WWY8_ARAVE|nr:hypothetical protein AVEN_251406-1 [Araneus ventricosus]
MVNDRLRDLKATLSDSYEANNDITITMDGTDSYMSDFFNECVNHEFIKLSGAIYDLKITKEMRAAATSARAKYMQYLESERSKEKTETKSCREGNRFFKTKENVPPNGHAPNK